MRISCAFEKSKTPRLHKIARKCPCRKCPCLSDRRGGGRTIGRRPGGELARHGNSSWNDTLIDTKFQSSSLEPVPSVASPDGRDSWDDSHFRLFRLATAAHNFAIEAGTDEVNKSLMGRLKAARSVQR